MRLTRPRSNPIWPVPPVLVATLMSTVLPFIPVILPSWTWLSLKTIRSCADSVAAPAKSARNKTGREGENIGKGPM